MSQVKIARAGVDDAFAVAALHLQHDRAGGAPIEAGYLDRFADWWLPQVESRPTWLATGSAGEAAGVLASVVVTDRPRVGRPDDRWLHLSFLYVAPAHRRHGIAARMLTQAQTWCGSSQLGRVQVRSTEDARALYARQGFGPAAGDLLEWRPVS